MAAQSSKRLLFIFNPVAGRAQARKALPELLRIFQANNFLPAVLVTGKHGDATRFAAQYAAQFDLVVCSGGDGTLSETVAGLAQSGFAAPLGYLPAGSTNVFADSHRLCPDLLTAAQQIMQGKERKIDIGWFNQRPFAYTVTFGAFSWLSYTTPQNAKNRLGHTAYILDGIRDLPLLKPQHLRLRDAEGNLHEGEYIFGTICNASTIACAFPLPPDRVDFSDGLFEVMLVRTPVSVVDLQNVLWGMRTHDYSNKLIDFFQTAGLHIESPDDAGWSLDGEEERSGGEINLRVARRALTLISDRDA
ncbi:MAG: YegS/Rv2252/BmrU family lipid kinase [Eubacteriales bacterium]|nr:YegS/Rv2252/BmrU family lipid kinase [Eubacteriales bacterium]